MFNAKKREPLIFRTIVRWLQKYVETELKGQRKSLSLSINCPMKSTNKIQQQKVNSQNYKVLSESI